MKKNLIPALLLVLMLLLGACSGETPPTEPPAPTEPPTVDIGGTELDPETASLDLSVLTYDMDTLLANAEKLQSVAAIGLGTTELTPEQIQTLCSAFPRAEVSYQADILGQVVAWDTQTLDLSAMDPARTDELLHKLALLPDLAEINFVNAEGICAYTIETIAELDKIRAAFPEVKLRVSFELHGQTVTSEDERIEYFCVPIGNEGVDEIRAVMPYLSSCTYFLLDGCEIDNEVMDQLRSDFPETKVVWRIWLTKPYYHVPRMFRCDGFLTDTHRIRTTLINNENSKQLKYCNEVKYVDFGHNYNVSDLSFLGYMPKLEVAIIGLTNCNDISFLVNCPELEYLEVYGSRVTDLSPLAACTKLKHLNISRMNVDDITCLYGLELERFRAVQTNVPQEQIDEYARLHPDCKMLMEGEGPHLFGWRKDENGNLDPRYVLLRQQMEYDIDAEYGIG